MRQSLASTHTHACMHARGHTHTHTKKKRKKEVLGTLDKPKTESVHGCMKNVIVKNFLICQIFAIVLL